MFAHPAPSKRLRAMGVAVTDVARAVVVVAAVIAVVTVAVADVVEIVAQARRRAAKSQKAYREVINTSC